MSLSDDVTLVYFVLGEDPQTDSFGVTVSKTALIRELREAIQASYKTKALKNITSIRLFKIDMQEEEAAQLTVPYSGASLANWTSVQAVWPETPDRHLIHILVQGTVVTHSSTGVANDSLGDLPHSLRDLEHDQDQTAAQVRNGMQVSELSKPSEFKKIQEGKDTPLLNGRPFENAGLPVWLYSEAFAFFLKEINAADVLPTARYLEVEGLLFSAQEIYSNEAKRVTAIKPVLATILNNQILSETIPKCLAGGLISITDGPLHAYSAILEVKNEIGTGGCDPSVQGAHSYAQCWSQLSNIERVRKLSSCPSFIIAIAGPWMCILGAVYLQRIVVQPLTDYMWLGLHPQDGGRLSKITQVLNSLARSLTMLGEAYRKCNLESINPDRSRFFPYLRHYFDEQKRLVRFEYQDPLVGGKPVFKALTEDGSPIVVKFVRQYNGTAHRLLADKNLTPPLLFDGSDAANVTFPRPGEMRMVVMQYIAGKNLSDCGSGNFIVDDLRRNVKEALDILHGHDLVFGDLRAPNVMVAQTGRGMLIDFDWCGKHGVSRYPTSINMDISWPGGVEKGGVMFTEHDEHMFQQLFG